VHSIETINHELPKAIYYDFGGQDYYHGVYQAFFTNEAVNLLVWNPESDHNKLLEKDRNDHPTRNYNRMYWLAQLQYIFTRRLQKQQQNEDPLLLIQTFADQYSKKNNLKEVHLTPNLIDQFHVSLSIDYQNSKNNTALSFLTATFWDTIAQQTDEKEVPKWYPEFLKYILNETQENAISLDLIIEYYKRENLSDEEKRTYLKEDLEQLSRKGLLLYYKNDDALSDVAWLNPSATVSNIHDTILSKKIIKEKGKLTIDEYQKLNINHKIVRLLLNEKILFFDEGYQEYIIPNYLPLASENDNNYDLLKYEFDKPAFVLKFERFIPFGFINQLICHYGQNPDKKQYWRNQLIFTLNREFKVWIQLDFSRLTISVSIEPKIQDNQKLNDCVQEIFIGIILLYWGKDISEIKDMGGFNEVFSGTFQRETTKLQQYKAIFDKTLKPEDLYISIDNKYFVHYNTLNDSERTKESIISYELPENENNLNKNKIKSKHSYVYNNYIDSKNIEITATESMQGDSNTTNNKRVKKIFISYSREDVDYKNELRKHLNMLNLFDIADNWSCEDITIGKWHDQIQKELEESDLVIFMLSVNFFNSPYILYQEVQKTIDEIQINPNKKIYSILVSKFAGLENYHQTNLDEKQKAILKLSDYQFGTYFREKNELTGNMEERLITLNEARRLDILDEQLTKITEKIMKDMK
jgi:internalin A